MFGIFTGGQIDTLLGINWRHTFQINYKEQIHILTQAEILPTSNIVRMLYRLH